MATFLVVDDEPMIRGIYRDMLEYKNHTVVGEASDGVECCSRLSEMEDPPDYILMDHRMPNKDGLETAAELLKENPRQKIILVSADEDIRALALKMGVWDFLEKPFRLERFLALVEGKEGRSMGQQKRWA